MKNFRALSVALVSALTLTGCGVIPGTGSDTRTVRIWLMQDSVSDDFLKRFTTSYEKDPVGGARRHLPGVDRYREEGHGRAGERKGPDIIEVGNTQVAQYAESDALLDLTLESVRDLGNEQWLPGLAEPGSINGSQYGIPWYAANRVVIYNKDLFADAGITAVPKTRAQWLDASEQLDDNGVQGIYLSGQDWYTLSGFIWDEGGDLAVERGGDWQATLDTPAALRGMAFYKELQAHGDGPKAADEETPPQSEVFAQGHVAQIIAVPGAATSSRRPTPT